MASHVIILNEQILAMSQNKTACEVQTISINRQSKQPFQATKLLHEMPSARKKDELHRLKPGAMFKVLDDGSWKFEAPYNMHNYDIAKVIGVTTHTFLIYSKKVGEQELPFYAYPLIAYGLQRGDELLIKGKKIVHNITMAKMKYEANQRFSKTK